jgi:TM2 domain-containing membrane protein YozV
MPEYHGDLMYQFKPGYRPKDHSRLAIGLVLLVTLGMTGIHQFYLGNHGFGWVHLVLCLLMMFALFTFSFTMLMVLIGLQAVLLLVEVVLMVIEES